MKRAWLSLACVALASGCSVEGGVWKAVGADQPATAAPAPSGPARASGGPGPGVCGPVYCKVGSMRVSVTYKGSADVVSQFEAWYKTDVPGVFVNQIFNEFKAFSGQKLVTIPKAGNYWVNVEKADGPWTVEITPP